MTLNHIEGLIAAYAEGLNLGGGRTAAACLREFGEFLREFGSSSIAELSKCKPRVAQMPNPTATAEDDNTTRVSDVTTHLRALESILRAAEARGRADEIRLLIKSLGDDSAYLSDMLNALRRALSRGATNAGVEDFVERLERDMGTDAFEQALGELKASPLRREQVVQIALRVYGGIPKSTSRKAALDFIRKPHDAQVNARRGH